MQHNFTKASLFIPAGWDTNIHDIHALDKKGHRQINLSNLVLHFSNLESVVTFLCLRMVHRNTF